MGWGELFLCWAEPGKRESSMDYLRGYRTVRNDPTWSSKMFLGVGISLTALFIPLLPGLVLAGWSAMVLRRSVHGIEAPLPRLDLDLDYLGKLLGPGFKGWVVGLLWSLPMTLLFFSFGMCAALGGITALGSAVDAAGDAGGYAALCCVGVGTMLMFPLLIVMTMPATVASMRAELTDDLGEGLKLGEVLSMTRLLFKELFIGTLVIGTIQFSLSLLGFFLCYFPALCVVWVGRYVHPIFQADLYRLYLARGGAPLSKLAPPEFPAVPPPQYPQRPQQRPPQAPFASART
jgi:hypothetical protein